MARDSYRLSTGTSWPRQQAAVGRAREPPWEHAGEAMRGVCIWRMYHILPAGAMGIGPPPTQRRHLGVAQACGTLAVRRWLWWLLACRAEAPYCHAGATLAWCRRASGRPGAHSATVRGVGRPRSRRVARGVPGPAWPWAHIPACGRSKTSNTLGRPDALPSLSSERLCLCLGLSLFRERPRRACRCSRTSEASGPPRSTQPAPCILHQASSSGSAYIYLASLSFRSRTSPLLPCATHPSRILFGWTKDLHSPISSRSQLSSASFTSSSPQNSLS